jgi:hypothetical protein
VTLAAVEQRQLRDLAREAFLRDRNADLNRRCRILRAECRRYERLLAMALRVATADGREADSLELLQVIAALTGDDLSRAPLPRRPPSDAELLNLLRRTAA